MSKTRSSHRIIDEVEHKHCPDCDKWFPLESFTKSRYSWDGLNSRCRACNSAAAKAWQQANPGRYRAKQRAYYEAHAEERKVARLPDAPSRLEQRLAAADADRIAVLRAWRAADPASFEAWNAKHGPVKGLDD